MVEHKTLDEQQIVDQQKMQCPFCKIVKGDIPSKKVYEDDKLLAVLDINPIRKGHILLMPKEHYPVMPMVPETTFEGMFIVTKRLSEVVKSIFEKSGTTIFIANGGAAGQQSAHFMLHIIPRDDGDGLINFEIPHHKLKKKEYKELFDILKNNLQIMLKDRYGQFPMRDSNGNVIRPRATEKRFTKSQVLQIIENNPQLKGLIMKSPEEFVDSVDKTPQLQQLFATLDVHEIVKEINPSYKKGKKKDKVVEAEFKEEPKKEKKKKTEKEPEPEEKEEEPVEQEDTSHDDGDDSDDDGANLDLISRMF